MRGSGSSDPGVLPGCLCAPMNQLLKLFLALGSLAPAGPHGSRSAGPRAAEEEIQETGDNWGGRRRDGRGKTQKSASKGRGRKGLFPFR